MFQLKGELAETHNIRTVSQVQKFLEDGYYDAAILDLQHSSLLFPYQPFIDAHLIGRAHLPFMRNDRLERYDTPVPSDPLISGIPDNLIHPWIMAIAQIPDPDMAIVVEGGIWTRSKEEWLNTYGAVNETINSWINAG
jgi:hypothetical protein